jgi:hypothetical protein
VNVDPDSPSSASTGRALTLAGAAALAGYAAHASFHLANGRWWDLLWTCHVAAALIGAGLVARSAALNAVGVLLSLLGLPLWILELTAGGEFFPTSLLTHVVALACGLFGLARLGMPRGVWWRAAAVLAGLIGLARLTTPAAGNVNVAFAVPAPWQNQFPSHAAYLACTLLAATMYFLAVQWLLRFLLAHRARSADLTAT